MTRDQIIDAFLIPLAWEPVNGDQKAAWPYAVMPDFGDGWLAFHRNAPLADEVNGGVALFSTEADAIAACEADHRAEAVKTWDIAKIEALVAENARRVQENNGLLQANLRLIRERDAACKVADGYKADFHKALDEQDTIRGRT